MKFFLKLFPLFIFIISCTESEKNIEQYSIETLMSNNRSSGGYFSKDADKLIYSSDKSGIFNIYEVDLSANEETQLTDSKEESFFVRGYSPNTGEVIYSADKGGNENSHIYLIREGNSIDLTPGENTKASFVGWTKDELGMYFISNSRDPRFFDLYKIDIVTLNSEMVFKNDSGYNLNSISNNDKYLVLSLNISRTEQKLFLQGKLQIDHEDHQIALITNETRDGKTAIDVYGKLGRLFLNDNQKEGAPKFSGPLGDKQRIAAWQKEKDGAPYLSLEVTEQQSGKKDIPF